MNEPKREMKFPQSKAPVTSNVAVIPVADKVTSNSACLLLIVAQKVYDDVLARVCMSELAERVGEVAVRCVVITVVVIAPQPRYPDGIAPQDPFPNGTLRLPHIVPYRTHQGDDYTIPQPNLT